MTTIHEAEQMGKARGLAAASWVFDGNTDQATYANVLAMLDAGDPEVYDTLGVSWLSGEWAGESIAEIFGDAEQDEEVLYAYEGAADEAYWSEVERTARLMVLATCRFCDAEIRQESGAWVDDTEGDCCSGDRDGSGENENKGHTP